MKDIDNYLISIPEEADAEKKKKSRLIMAQKIPELNEDSIRCRQFKKFQTRYIQRFSNVDTSE